jgi:hypothetical protein
MVNGSYEDVLLYLFFLESCSRRPFQSIAESHSSKSEREHPLPPPPFLPRDRGTGEKGKELAPFCVCLGSLLYCCCLTRALDRRYLAVPFSSKEAEQRNSMEDLLESEQRRQHGEEEEDDDEEQQVVYCAVGKKEAGREWNWKANLLWVLANLPRRRKRLVFLHLHRPASRINMSTYFPSSLSPVASFFFVL